MRAMILDEPQTPLRRVDIAVPQPGAGQILLQVEACGVCRTDLHLVDGELPHPRLPVIPGHEIVGRVAAVELAPLLCAGLIGYRALSMAGDARRIGLYGFGAAAHILAQVLAHQGRPFYAFTRTGDAEGQAFARSLGAAWAGDSGDDAPEALDAALIFAPAGELVPAALRQVRKGGAVVCAGIHMSEIPAFPYDILWGERVLRSVANLTREDGARFLRIVGEAPIHTRVRAYPLEQANEALATLRRGEVQGAAVLVPG